MTTLEGRLLGRTGLRVTPVCIGTSAIGGMPGVYGYDVAEEQAIETLRRVFDGPITFVDTSNGYGDGESERRIGKALREIGGLPDVFVLATPDELWDAVLPLAAPAETWLR